MRTLVQSPRLQRLLIGVGALFVLLAAFTGGVRLGERKARRLTGWCEGYQRVFGTKKTFRTPPPFTHTPLPASHGVFGKVISLSDDTLAVQDKLGLEQIVRVSSSTAIRMGRDLIKLEELRPGFEVAVFGNPSADGFIDAHLIRLIPRR